MKDVYVGRGIVIGKVDHKLFAAYFVTGRSPSSKARKLVQHKRVIATDATDPEILAKGNPELLLYHAMILSDDFLVVGNGRQTDTIFTTLKSRDTMGLSLGHEQWNPEPDDPNYTPRISGVLHPKESIQYLGIIKNGEDRVLRPEWPIESTNGEGHLITTYTGENKEPLPSFEGGPKRIIIPHSEHDLEEHIADCVEKEMGNPDYRVALAVVVHDGMWPVQKKRNYQT